MINVYSIIIAKKAIKTSFLQLHECVRSGQIRSLSYTSTKTIYRERLNAEADMRIYLYIKSESH